MSLVNNSKEQGSKADGKQKIVALKATEASANLWTRENATSLCAMNVDARIRNARRLHAPTRVSLSL